MRIHKAWLGVLVLAACSGKDHSLGEGRAPAEPNSGTGGEEGTAEQGTGGSAHVVATPDAGTVGTGGAPTMSAAGGAPTMSAAGGAPVSSGGAGVARPADAGALLPPAVPVIPAITGACPAWENGVITFMGLEGIQVAAGTKPPAASAPMLVYWHGTGSTSGEYTFMAGPVAAGVTAAGGVVVSFQGTAGGDLLSGTSIFGAGDLTIVDQLVACAVKDHNVDPQRIYTMGCSAGGLFATAMAALRSQYVAAVAPNSGGLIVPVPFQNEHTPPLMTVHGAGGVDVVAVDFSETSATADMAFKARGGFVIDCNTGGGHCGGAGFADDAWRFFQSHPFGVSPEPWESGLPAGFSTQCTIK